MDLSNFFSWDSTHSWAMNLMAITGSMLLAAKIRVTWYAGSERKLALQEKQATISTHQSQSPRATRATRYQSSAWAVTRAALALAVWICFSVVLVSGTMLDPMSAAPRWETSSLLLMLGMLMMSRWGGE